MNQAITIRKYQDSDIQALADIYYHTIHNVNNHDYTESQVNVWAPPVTKLGLDSWKKKWIKLKPIVAIIENQIVGFAEFESNGHIDCFYVHHQFQGHGIGTALINAIEQDAIHKNISRIYAEVSITAKEFFLKKGFNIVKQQTLVIRSIPFINFVMEKYLDKSQLSIDILKAGDIPIIVEAFAKSNWTQKPASTFKAYLREQDSHQRVVWVAYYKEEFAGYVTLKWKSQYEPFIDAEIPEIMDLNVLPAFRNLGAGSRLLKIAEDMAVTMSNTVGIGVGLYGGLDGGYGAAQKLYINRGYIPDGQSVTYNYQTAIPGENYPLNDELILWFIKKLR